MELKIVRAYRTMSVTPSRYLLTFIVPGTLLPALAVFGLIYFVDLPGYFRDILIMLPIFLFVLLLAYPLIRYERDQGRIDQEMHMFITRMGILSLSEISGKTMFYILDEMAEYGRLANEVNKVYALVRNLRINLSEACREVAKTTPSEGLSDFLNRLAHAIETGEDARDFFRKEQEVVMDQYKIKYDGAITDLGLMNEIFVAIMVLATLILTMFLIIPMIVELPLPPLGLLILSVFLFGIMEGVFLFAYWIVLPREQLWQKSDIPSDVRKRIFRWFLYSFIICDIVAAVVVFLHVAGIDLPMPITVALVITPMAISGYQAMNEEAEIKRKEDRYPAYMRSLGISTAAKGGVAREALSKLRHHDFGPLSKHIDNLYKRLSMRVNEVRSWKYFNAEVGSDLISKFSDMYVRGTLAGAKPKEASGIVSTNFIKMLQLRKKRYQATTTLVAILYGVTVMIAITVFMTIFAVDWMVGFANNMPTAGSLAYTVSIPILSNPNIFQIPGLYAVGMALIIVNAFVCATIIRIANAGHPVNFLLHFVGLVWTGAVVAVSVEVSMTLLKPASMAFIGFG